MKTNYPKNTRAEAVARDVIASVSAGKKPNMQQIQIKNGYSVQSARAMKATKAQAYQVIMEDYEKRVKNRLKGIIERSLSRIEEKLESGEKTTSRDLAYVMDLSQKNLNLMEGKATGNIALNADFKTTEEARKYIESVLEGIE